MEPAPTIQPEAIAPGQLIGSYRIERLLGEGGMAQVFLAVHERIRKRAAIKVLKAPFASDPTVAVRFVNEALAVNLIQHPGLVNIFDHGHTAGGAPYLIMDYLEGASLAERLREGALPAPDALRLGREVALALSAAHAQGIIHRDLKPGNIMLVQDGEGRTHARVLDFGIARLGAQAGTHVTTQAHLFMGTPAYAAPEQCFGVGKATERSDVYALGVVLYQMLAGRPPFSGDDAAEVLSQHVYDTPPALAEARPGLPGPLCALVHAMLGKEPGRRPSMDAVAEALLGLARPEVSLPAAPAPTRMLPAASATVLSGAQAAPRRASSTARPRTSRRWLVRAALALILCAGLAARLWPLRGPAAAPGTAQSLTPAPPAPAPIAPPASDHAPNPSPAAGAAPPVAPGAVPVPAVAGPAPAVAAAPRAAAPASRSTAPSRRPAPPRRPLDADMPLLR